MKTTDLKKLAAYIDGATTVLLLQPDKPDGDSVATALALEEIMSDLEKNVVHYCAGRVEPYLSYLDGWDRIGEDWPRKYDVAILVDCAASEQIPRLIEAHRTELEARPMVLIDHHTGGSDIKYLDLMVLDEYAAATGELIFEIAGKLKWPLSKQAYSYLTSSILSDTMNLTNGSTTAKTVEVFAKIVKAGEVNLYALNQRFKESTAQDPEMLAVKGKLLSTVEFYADGQIALVVVTAEMLELYRNKTNLAVLVFYDMLNTRGVKLAVVMNEYPNLIRTSMRAKLEVAGPIAEHFGGGGHPMAAAFPAPERTIAALKPEFIEYAAKVIARVKTN